MTAQSRIDAQTNLILRLHMIWRILFALVAAGVVIMLWVGQTEMALWQKVLLSIAGAAASGFSAFGAFQISKRNHAGRMTSLVIDYLGFVACFVFALNTGEFFIGIDALGETFSKGIPYLGITALGYFLGMLEEYFPVKKTTAESSLKVVSRWVMIGGFVLFLWQVDAKKDEPKGEPPPKAAPPPKSDPAPRAAPRAAPPPAPKKEEPKKEEPPAEPGKKKAPPPDEPSDGL